MVDELLRPEKRGQLNKAEFSQPLCTAVQIALVNLLTMWGIFPAAAYAANVITSEAAITVAYYRGQVTKLQTRPGGMAVIGMGRKEIISYLVRGVVIACENSPRSVTLSGDQEQLDGIVKRVNAEQPEVSVRHLKVEMAYHSRPC